MKDLLRIADLTPADLAQLTLMAERFTTLPDFQPLRLGHRTVVMYFAKPSTRTRISFTAAITNLGGMPLTVGPDELQLGRGETIEDTARVISRFASAIVIRTFSDDDVHRLAAAATVPVVNALTDGHHPCQALADILTLKQHFGRLDGLRVAYVGDGNNVTHSLVEACALAGIDIAVATPRGYEPHPDVMAAARLVAAANGSRVELTSDPRAAADGADAIYTDVWLSMGDSPHERDVRHRDLAPYQVNAALMAVADPDAVFLHCLPAHRGEEVSAEVIDGPRSLVFPQAGNRLPTAQAVLEALLDNQLVGTGGQLVRSS